MTNCPVGQGGGAATQLPIPFATEPEGHVALLPPADGAQTALPADHAVIWPAGHAAGDLTQLPAPFATMPAGQFAVDPPGDGTQTVLPLAKLDCDPGAHDAVVAASAGRAPR